MGAENGIIFALPRGAAWQNLTKTAWSLAYRWTLIRLTASSDHASQPSNQSRLKTYSSKSPRCAVDDQPKQQQPIKSDLWRAFMAQYNKRQQKKRKAVDETP